VWCREKLPGLLHTEGVVVDGKRVAALGHSAGGGLALILVSLAPPLPCYSPAFALMLPRAPLLNP
jgi:acetyl esterase/lipase